MARFVIKVSFLFILLILLSIQGLTNLEQQNQIQTSQAQLKKNESLQNLNLDPDFGKIPLYFISNEGQVDEKALFYAKASRYTLWLTQEGLVFDSTRRINKDSTESIRQNPRDKNDLEDIKYERDVSRLVFVNANRSPEVVPADDTEHRVNYLKGNDKSKWQTNIQTSGAVLYGELYPNIDLKIYGIEKQIEYDFVVKPGGEVSDISFEYKDVEKTRIDKEGNLVIKTEFGELGQTKPVCYQVIEGERIEIKAEFKKIKNDTYGFKVEEYNKNHELIIDPVVLVYSTYLGGADEERCEDIVVDSEGSAYVTGTTFSTNFPTKNPLQGSPADYGEVFITKVNSSGNALIYSTYLGGYEEDWCFGIAVDLEGAAYVTGYTSSTNYPLKNPVQESFGGGAWDNFVTKISPSGSALIYSTYLGGSDNDGCFAIALDSEGAACVTGRTKSADYPTKNPIQGNKAGQRDAFITKINASGNALIYSTYLGGSSSGWDGGADIAVDSEGAAYVAGFAESTDFPLKNPIQSKSGGGTDVFIFKVNASGNALIYSTYLGGSEDDWALGIEVDSGGAAYVTGYTSSTNFPLNHPIQGSYKGDSDIFIAKINASGSALSYSTYLGGTGLDVGSDIAVDSKGTAYVTGMTQSLDFPTKNPFQGSYAGGDYDAFITKINASGNALIYSTYLGGSEDDRAFGIATDANSAIYIAGNTDSTDFPIKSPIQGSYAGGTDVFIAKISGSVEKIRIVSWNILNYPDLNGEPREEYFRSILESLSPDILVVQEMASTYGVNQFLTNVMKPISKKYKAAKFYDGPDTDSALFYDKSKFKVQRPQQILTSFRDISEYSVKIKKGPGKGSQFKIYSVHFTEGLGINEKKQREEDAKILRTYLNGLPLNSLFLVCGTFNMTESNEKAYKILTDVQIDDIGRLKDPIANPGKWHHKKKFKSLHTESTRRAKYGDGASGGLNDRFDMILISYSLDQNGKLTYRPGSCVAYGNDGKHFKKDINKPTNKVVSPDLADALYKASDHLPVIIELKPEEKSTQTNKLN